MSLYSSLEQPIDIDNFKRLYRSYNSSSKNRDIFATAIEIFNTCPEETPVECNKQQDAKEIRNSGDTQKVMNVDLYDYFNDFLIIRIKCIVI